MEQLQPHSYKCIYPIFKVTTPIHTVFTNKRCYMTVISVEILSTHCKLLIRQFGFEFNIPRKFLLMTRALPRLSPLATGGDLKRSFPASSRATVMKFVPHLYDRA